MKNYQSLPTGSKSFFEVNASASFPEANESNFGDGRFNSRNRDDHNMVQTRQQHPTTRSGVTDPV